MELSVPLKSIKFLSIFSRVCFCRGEEYANSFSAIQNGKSFRQPSPFLKRLLTFLRAPAPLFIVDLLPMTCHQIATELRTRGLTSLDVKKRNRSAKERSSLVSPGGDGRRPADLIKDLTKIPKGFKSFKSPDQTAGSGPVITVDVAAEFPRRFDRENPKFDRSNPKR